MLNQDLRESPLIEDPWEMSDVIPNTKIPEWHLPLTSQPLIALEKDPALKKLPMPRLTIPMLLEDQLKIKDFGGLLQEKIARMLALLYWFEDVKKLDLAENLA